MIAGRATVDLEREDVARVLEQAAKVGLTIRVNDGQLSLQMKYGQPPDQLVTRLRQNKSAVLTAVQLQQRLEIGWQKVEMEADVDERNAKEEFWLKLLADYEQAAGRIIG